MEQNISESTNLSLYKRLHDISAIRFHEIKFSGNIFMLDKDYEEEKVYNALETTEITTLWYNLYDEYFEKTDDPRFRKDLKHKKSSLKLLLEISLLKSILKILNGFAENIEHVPGEILHTTISSIRNDVKRINKRIDVDSTYKLKDNISNIESYVSGLQTRYELKFKDDLVVEEKDITHYYETCIQIARVLNMDYIPDHINMLQYIAYEKTYKRELSNAKQHRRKQTGSGFN